MKMLRAASKIEELTSIVLRKKGTPFSARAVHANDAIAAPYASNKFLKVAAFGC